MNKNLLWVLIIIVLIVGFILVKKSSDRSLLKNQDSAIAESSNSPEGIQSEINKNINSELEVDEKLNELENKGFQ